MRCGEVLRADRPSVLLVTHNASRSGAPIVALEIAGKLSEQANVVTLAVSGGELLGMFQKVSVGLYVLGAGKGLAGQIRGVIAKHKPKAIVINSMASRRAFPALKASGLPCVLLVHELADKMQRQDEVEKASRWVRRMILSTEMAAGQAFGPDRRQWPANHRILPQGQCRVPSGPKDEGGREGLLRRMQKKEGEVLVMGMGSLILTKGVDLFLEMVRQLRHEAPNIDSLWFGAASSAGDSFQRHLLGQCRLCGLDAEKIFAGVTGHPALAQSLNDIFVLPSRSDTLPNVAIDAMLAGRPVVCFAGASGIAPIIAAAGLAEHCLAQPFDPADLARKVRVLAGDGALRERVGKILQAQAEVMFDRETYLEAMRGEVMALVMKGDAGAS